MSITRNAIVNLCKSSSRPKVSRVCFTTAYRNPQGDGPRKSEYSPYNADEAVGDMARQEGNEMKGEGEGVVEKTKEYAHDAKEMVKDKSKEAMNKAQEMGEKAKVTTQKMKDKVTGMDDDVDVEDFIEDHVKKPAREADKRP